ncbi:putative RNA recognition motif domain, nucleotide-binding alpha-beta plait domain superfamily [Helianthus annuus]|nr:putative RNA recognition motif domain, nucleotide-binding alpha-beta plait domain superfamily [Helianthus annuus]
MAFSGAFRRVLNGSSSIMTSHFASARFSSTLTAPKLFISGLNRNTTDEKLKEAFAPFGQLVEAKVIMDRATQRSKGFAFVTYASIEEAEKAREGMNAKFLDGWVIFVDPAKPKEYRPPPQPDHNSLLNSVSEQTRLSAGVAINNLLLLNCEPILTISIRTGYSNYAY